MLTLYAAVTRATLDGRNPGGWFPQQKLTVAEAVERARGPGGGLTLGHLHEVIEGGPAGEYAGLATLFTAGILARVAGPVLWCLRGRDLFAPVAARLARGDPLTELARPTDQRSAGRNWPDDFSEIVYVDHYGNALTGLRGVIVPPGARLTAGGAKDSLICEILSRKCC